MVKKALCLTGGGVKGAFQVGALEYLIGQCGEEYDIITGISVGALNGSFLAQSKKSELKDGIRDLQDLWYTIDNSSIRKNWFPFCFLHYLWEKSLYDSSPLEKMIDEVLDLEKLRNSDILLNVGAQAVGSGIYTEFDSHHPEIKNAVKASAAFPIFLKMVKIGGEWYVDGGVKETAPLRKAIELGAEHITIINTGPLDSQRINPNNLDVLEYPMRMIELQGDEIVKNDLSDFLEINKMIKDGTLANTSKRYIDYLYIEPEKRLVSNPLEFDPKEIKRMMTIGYTRARLALQNKNK